MKIAGKKIPKGNGLLFFGFVAISLSVLLIISAVRTEQRNSLNKYTLYSGHQKEFSIDGGDGIEQWQSVIPKLQSEYKKFSIYVPLEDPQILLRGICIQGHEKNLPMIWGEYFDYSTSWTDEPKAVLGSDYQKNVIERDGKKYYIYNGVEFEVIGIMGTEEESRINHMLMIDFKSAVKMTGINTNYVLDSSKRDISKIGKDIFEQMPFPATAIIVLEEGMKTSFVEQFLSSDAIVDTMYVMILISFSLSTILVTLIWLRFRRQLFFVCNLCGYENYQKCAEISKRFYMVAGAGFVTGVLLMLVMFGFVSEICIELTDILRAFGVTIGLGTVILCICYFLSRRKACK